MHLPAVASPFDSSADNPRIPQLNSLTGDNVGVTYTNWDSDSIFVCNCDTGYSGYDCSQHLCPMGDDLETTGQASKQITITVASTGGAPLAGYFGFKFAGYRT